MKTKIFLAEDDPLMIRMYEKAFKLSGFDIETAFDGESAINKLRAMKSKPTIVVLDVMMPKMSGFDVLRELKQDPDLKTIPVVMLTNLVNQGDAETALGLGAVLYLTKSQYDPKEIMEKIKEIVSGYSKKETPEVKVKVKDINARK